MSPNNLPHLVWTPPASAHVYGFSWRKLRILKDFLPNTRLKKIRHLNDKQLFNQVILVWGMRELPAEIMLHNQIVRVEDGFLRSVGLGAALTAPISWVFDDLGLYLNARHPSRLELILEGFDCDKALLTQAARLRARVVEQKLSKYNLASEISAWRRSDEYKQVVLVIGQVEGDASIAFGSPKIKSNLEFLKTVRAARPQAHIIYRPHPDVVQGWRKEATPAQAYEVLADTISIGGNVLDWFELVDEVHVLTSLTGFEALLRGKTVYCYGQPFYAGWGLTVDDVPFPEGRRTRSLLLEELVAGSLLLYPRYRSLQNAGTRLDAEQSLDELKRQQPSKWRQSFINTLKPWLRRW